ncbi:hypothetical protein CIB95_04985 [Lottiidibacillus patelloidae]|uniref:Uncharacterized protein n=1 Tax=Lottiidibacillus patelloidae TaxID=2670334 RepID=A0A263BVE4_9BACI|nr:hypothetical protein [Lottiidibacillus patelloidae]OZM57723.1 hypothetical protein CIB95_04985 [Lottiidibacillus patelloidae]
MNWKKIFTSKLLIAFIALLIVFLIVERIGFFNTNTGTVVTVLEVNEDTMLVENIQNEQFIVKVPKIITPLLIENNEYFIEYEYSNWSKPNLVYIQY